jgi:hypothetical protein
MHLALVIGGLWAGGSNIFGVGQRAYSQSEGCSMDDLIPGELQTSRQKKVKPRLRSENLLGQNSTNFTKGIRSAKTSSSKLLPNNFSCAKKAMTSEMVFNGTSCQLAAGFRGHPIFGSDLKSSATRVLDFTKRSTSTWEIPKYSGGRLRSFQG